MNLFEGRAVPVICSLCLLVFLILSFCTITVLPSASQDDAEVAQGGQTLWEEGHSYLRFEPFSRVKTLAAYGLLWFGPSALTQQIFGDALFAARIFPWLAAAALI